MLRHNEVGMHVDVGYGHPGGVRRASDEFVRVMEVAVLYVLLPLMGMEECIYSNDPTRLYPMYETGAVWHPEYVLLQLDLVGPHDDAKREQIKARIIEEMHKLFSQIPGYDWISFCVTISSFQEPMGKTGLIFGEVRRRPDNYGMD